MATSRTTSTPARLSPRLLLDLRLRPLRTRPDQLRGTRPGRLGRDRTGLRPPHREPVRTRVDDRVPEPHGRERAASIVLPAWYGPDNNPVLPVVISPHGRAGTGHSNAKYFGNMPAFGRFALISPDGMGRRLKNFSYGAPGQIDDLAKMPDFATRALPWLRLDRTRVYAIGSSMGGQETLLLVARHPGLLAGAAALDSVTDLTRRYRQMPQLPCPSHCLEKWGKPYGTVLQSTLRREVGGSPAEGERLRREERHEPGPQARIRTGPAPDLVECGRRHRVRPGASVAGPLREGAPYQSMRFGLGVRRALGTLTEMRPSALLPIALMGFGLLTDRVKDPAGGRRPAGRSALRSPDGRAMRTAVALLACSLALGAPGAARDSCLPTLDAGSRARIDQALRAGRDLWGEALLAAPDGPTYDGVRRYLPPLLLADAPRSRRD